MTMYHLQAIDKDNSGSIDSSELSKLGGNMSKEKLEALMTKLDTDGDGKITLEEFRGLFKQVKKTQSPGMAVANVNE